MSVTISKLSTDHNETGLGIAQTSPRLSWRFDGCAEDWKQSSYDIRITRSSSTKDFHVDSAQSVLVPWPDTPLHAKEKARVQVKANAEDGSSTGWRILDIEAGLLSRQDWISHFISGEPQPIDKPHRPIHFKRKFDLATIPSCARLYATAYGLYTIQINGKFVGDHVLAPGWQSYAYRLSYQTFDVGELLQRGENLIQGVVGEGWYCGRLGFFDGVRNVSGNTIALLAQLEGDGNVIVNSDKSWEWSYGPILSSEIYDGEVFDSRLSPSSWKPVREIGFTSAPLKSPQAPPIRRTGEITPIEVIKSASGGEQIVDFGQNFAGWVRWNVQVDGEGQVVIRHAEVLEHGDLGTRPLRGAKATDSITLGGVTQGYEPSFTFHGFRYISVKGFPRTIQLTDFTGIVVHTDMERTGHFESSHKLINKLHENVVWGMRGNFVSVPTDCAARDERLGWTADLMAFAPTASLLYDTSGILSEWLQDVACEQLQEGNGVPPVVTPAVCKSIFDQTFEPLSVWGDVAAITPWDLHVAFGDTKMLQDQWESMTTWLDKGIPRSPVGLWDPNVNQLGDWLDPKAAPTQPAIGITDLVLTSDSYLIHATRLVAKIGRVLGHSKEAAKYEQQVTDLLAAFHKEYVTPNGRLMSDSQCGLVCALAFDLATTPSQTTAWIERLDYLVRREFFCVGTGFAGTFLILKTLAKFGKLQTAYRMLQTGKCPSWLYQVNMGATTMWERWDSMLPDGSINPGEMTSFNHYAFGSVAAFFYNIIGGLSSLEAGWKKILIQPQPGGSFTHANTSVTTPYGLVSCNWKLSDDHSNLHVKVTVPPNTTALLKVGEIEKEIGSGVREYEVPWRKDPNWPPKQITLPYSWPPVDEFL